MSLYHILFLCTLSPAVILGFWRKGDFRVVAIILLASFSASYLAFQTPYPIWYSAVSDLMFSALIAAFCQNRTAVVVGITFALSAQLSVIYGMANAPNQVYHPLYAHALSVLGHIENVVLAVGAWDGGSRVGIYRGIRRLWPSLDTG